jgi:uncharacterized LabA/DUF88 family protein
MHMLSKPIRQNVSARQISPMKRDQHNAIEEGPAWRDAPKPVSERIAIFIDGSNLFYGANQLGCEVDYRKLLVRLTQGRSLLRAYFYTGVDPHNDKQRGFLLWLRRNGYRVMAKDLITMPDQSKKANLEVEMAIDMISLCGYCDTVVLLSSNGNLAYALNQVSYKGIQVEVVGLRSMVSESLLSLADRYVDLAEIKTAIQKP